METAVALAILGTIAVALLSGLVAVNQAASTVDERTTAESLAQLQLEWVQNAAYAADYTALPLPGTTAGYAIYPDYANYSASISVDSLADPDEGIQKITVTITRSGVTVFVLEGYKREP